MVFWLPTGDAMKIIADENIPCVLEAFAGFGEVTVVPGRQINHALLHDVDMLLVRSVTRVNEELLGGTPVSFVASATIGLDHIDLPWLKQNNVGFAYAPSSNADSVAEYVVSALLLLAKQNGVRPEHLCMGVLGVGNVGSRVFKNALAMGMRTVLCDPPKKKLTQCELYRPLEVLLSEADVISLHVPLTTDTDDATYHMVNADFIDRMKPGAILINTSRGSVIDEAALTGRGDRFGGLVFDVWEDEPLIRESTLNLATIATPHIAGYSFDGKIRGTVMIYEAASAYFFKKLVWTPPDAIFENLENAITFSSQDTVQLADVVLRAYPIMQDDALLRTMFSLPHEKQAEYFDELRRTYRKRPEFSHYRLPAGCCSDVLIAQLRQLGFQLPTC